jgi:hypothetical protein
VPTEVPRPPHIRYALIALWGAWLLSATALVINQFVFGGSGIGPGLSLGMVSLAVQAVVFVSIARGSLVARAIVVAFLVLAVLPLQMVQRLVAEHSLLSATYTALSFALKALGSILLFTDEAKTWFEAQR